MQKGNIDIKKLHFFDKNDKVLTVEKNFLTTKSVETVHFLKLNAQCLHYKIFSLMAIYLSEIFIVLAINIFILIIYYLI